MRSDVQVLVDRLAEELGRSVTLCDADDDLVAYSELIGPMDDHRRRWVLTRGQVLPGEVPLREFVAGTPGTVHRTPSGDAGPGSLARLMHVIVDGGVLLGAMSVIDEAPPLTAEERALVLATVDRVRPLLRRDHDAAQRRLEEHADLLRPLLDPDPARRADAVAAVLDTDLLAATGPVTVLVASLDTSTSTSTDTHTHTGTSTVQAEARQVLREALHHARLRHGTRRSLGAVLHGRAVLLLLDDTTPPPTTTTHGAGPSPGSPGTPPGHGTTTDDVAHRLHDHVSGRLRLLHDDIAVAVAVSDPHPTLHDAHHAYDQALRVCRVATTVGGFDTVVTSAVVGVYDILGRLPDTALTRTVLPPGLLRLIDRPGDSDTLLTTLECYLDHAGNAVAAAQQLFVHRGTLYYRLDRIEDITGAQLRDGMQRLSLHVGIKLARLAGIIR